MITEETPAEEASAEDTSAEDTSAEEGGGSLASGLLSAGFGSGGTVTEMPPVDAEATPDEETEGSPTAAEETDEVGGEPEAEAPEEEVEEAAEEAVADEVAAIEDPAADEAPADEDAPSEEPDAVPSEDDSDDTTEEAEAPEDSTEDDSEDGTEEEAAEEEAHEVDASDEDDTAEEEEAEEEEPISPFDLPGDWYVIHSYSGYENKVKANLATRTSSMHMEDRIFEVVIPMESVVEIKGGRKVEVEKKMFPGYILVRMYLDDDSWYTVRNTPGVTAFVGGGIKPTPLSRREVERFLGVKKEEEKKAPRFKPAWEVGEIVRVVAGPFADFNGVIEDMNVDQQKVSVLVEIFGRDTPMELNFEDIQKQ